MQNVEEQALLNYYNNMEFLKKHHNETFHKVDIYQNRLESRRAIENYALEYLPEGYFDVKEISSGNFLYADNSFNISQELTKKVDFKKNRFSFQGFSLVHNYENAKLNDTASSHKGIYPIMSYYLDNYPYETTMKQIEKFIFIGVGLGLHIEQIHNKINAEQYFIIEDDLELFRLSLFTTPYYKFLRDKAVVFSIATNDTEFNSEFKNFLEMSFYLNRLIKYSFFPAHSEKKIQLIKTALASQNFLTFGYNTQLKKLLKPLNFLNSGYKVLNMARQMQLKTIKDTPVLIVGAGPSLGQHIEWLKENQDKFIIFAVATTLKLLHEHNIKPDIISHIDGFQAGFKNFEGFAIKEFVKDSIAILGSFVEQRVIDIFNKDLVYMMEEDTFYFKDFSSVAAPCIGSTSIANSLLLGFKEIYLLGMDLSLTNEGKTHYSGHKSNNGAYDIKEKKTEIDSQISLRGDIFNVKGNFSDNVKTTPLFYNSITSINNSIKQLKTDSHHIYNLNDGAFLNGTIPLQNETVKLPQINKKQILENLNNELSQLSKTKLDDDDIHSMQSRLDYAYLSAQIIKKYENSNSYNDASQYLYNIYDLVIKLYPNPTRENRNIVSVFDTFFQYTIPLVYDMCNTKEREDFILKDLQYVDKLITKELKRIVTIYINKLEKFLKEKC